MSSDHNMKYRLSVYISVKIKIVNKYKLKNNKLSFKKFLNHKLI